MIYGEGVGAKYNVIIAGRRAELYQGISLKDREQKHNQLWDFIQDIRSCTREEFNQWYQLYNDVEECK